MMMMMMMMIDTHLELVGDPERTANVLGKHAGREPELGVVGAGLWTRWWAGKLKWPDRIVNSCFNREHPTSV